MRKIDISVFTNESISSKQSNIQIPYTDKSSDRVYCGSTWTIRYRECLVSSSDDALPTGCSLNDEIQKSGSTRL